MAANTWEQKRTLRISGSIGFGIGAVLIAFILLAYYAYTWRSYFHFQYTIDQCVKPFCDPASYPLLHTLSWGQVSLFYTVAVLVMLVLLERNHRVLATALFAFAVSFKFFPLIFLAPSAATLAYSSLPSPRVLRSPLLFPARNSSHWTSGAKS